MVKRVVQPEETLLSHTFRNTSWFAFPADQPVLLYFGVGELIADLLENSKTLVYCRPPQVVEWLKQGYQQLP